VPGTADRKPRSNLLSSNYATDTFQQITGRPPRPLAEFLHDCGIRVMPARHAHAIRGGLEDVAVVVVPAQIAPDQGPWRWQTEEGSHD
jgi:hypothetical protein